MAARIAAIGISRVRTSFSRPGLSVERSTRSNFLTPREGPILSFSACLAENPDALKIAGFYARNARRMARNPRIIEMAHLPVSTLLRKNWLRS
jgi:hypothetical protein